MQKQILAFFLFLISISLQGQSSDSIKTRLEENYRSYLRDLIEREKEAYNKLKILNAKWRNNEPDSLTYKKLTRLIRYNASNRNLTYEKVKEAARRQYPKSKLPKLLLNEDCYLIRKNSELNFALGSHLFSGKKLEMNSRIVEEILAYDIQANETIADIGTGEGYIPFFIGLLNMDNHIYLNELSTTKSSLLSDLFKKIPEKFSPSSFEIITGKETNIRLPKKSCDKIIARQSYHHFVFKRKMLKSIARSLKKNGELIIVEPFKEDNLGHSCDKLMSRSQLLRELKKYGFILVHDQRIQDITMMKFKFSN